MTDEKLEAVEKLIAACNLLVQIGDENHHPDLCMCGDCVDSRNCRMGVAAIREMQAERDDLRDKLRATEEAMDVAEGKVERLEEERNTLGAASNE